MKRTEDENPKQRRYEQGGSHAQKVKRALCLIPILLIAALAITYAAIRHNARSPQELIKSKWGIELPQSCVQVYSAIGEIGIDGRGPKYRVFECGDSEDMKKLLHRDLLLVLMLQENVLTKNQLSLIVRRDMLVF